MELQIRGEGGIDRIRNITDEEITPELENITGIAGVQVYGGQQKSIEVRLNEKACKAYGITWHRSQISEHNGKLVQFCRIGERGNK